MTAIQERVKIFIDSWPQIKRRFEEEAQEEGLPHRGGPGLPLPCEEKGDIRIRVKGGSWLVGHPGEGFNKT
jgi:hypothetical protein